MNNEEPCNLYSSSDIIKVFKSRMMRWEGHISTYGRNEKCIQNLVRKPEGKRQIGRPKHTWEDNY
jgi:hypothetical protein